MALPVKVSINLTGLHQLLGDLPAVLAAARTIDELHVDQMTVSEHVAMSDAVEGYPYGIYPSTPEEDWFEPVATLSALAAITHHARLSTSILIAPLRSAPLLAKQLATLDHISKGRLEIGLGTGWQRAEYDASGIPFEGRLKRLEDQVRAMQALWTQAPAAYAGETVHFDRLYSLPHPRQSGGVPIIFGLAPTPSNLRRMVELGSGWAPWFGIPGPGTADHARADNLDVLRSGVNAIRAGFIAADRLMGNFLIRVMPQPETGADGSSFDLEKTLRNAADYVAAGATMLEFAPGLFARHSADIIPITQRIVEWRERINAE